MKLNTSPAALTRLSVRHFPCPASASLPTTPNLLPCPHTDTSAHTGIFWHRSVSLLCRLRSHTSTGRVACRQVWRQVSADGWCGPVVTLHCGHSSSSSSWNSAAAGCACAAGCGRGRRLPCHSLDYRCAGRAAGGMLPHNSSYLSVVYVCVSADALP